MPILEVQADFALNLLREVSKDSVSTVLSPISVAIALSMVYLGAKDQTAKEMGQVLAKEAPESEVHEYFGQLLKMMNDGEKNYTLEVANKLYVKSGFELMDAFKTAINDHYGGQFESVDFEQNVDTAKLDMMHKTAFFIYYENDQLQLLGMPYVGEDMFMFLVLPKKRFGLDEVLADMTGASLLELVRKRHNRKVDVVLPKFKLESMHNLNEPLMNLGMQLAFSVQANFNRITDKEPLQISQVIQKAFIELNEEGTEAAAVGVCEVRVKKSIMAESQLPEFKADQPFLMILISGNGKILFNGVFWG